MAKVTRDFEIIVPITEFYSVLGIRKTVHEGDLHVSGKAYYDKSQDPEDRVSIDIDRITLNESNDNLLPLFTSGMLGSINECDNIYNPAIEHARHVVFQDMAIHPVSAPIPCGSKSEHFQMAQA